MWNNQRGTPQFPHWADPEGIVREMMENAAIGNLHLLCFCFFVSFKTITIVLVTWFIKDLSLI